jgi:hypothetical protein
MDYEDLVEDMRYDTAGKLVCNDNNIQDYFDLYYADPTMFRQPQPIGEWNVSAVTNMEYLFKDAHEFDEPLHNWDVIKLLHMKGMFQDARAFDQDISNWDLPDENPNFLPNTDRDKIFLNCPIRNEYKPRIFQSDAPTASDMPAAEEEFLPEQQGGYYKKTRSRRRKSRARSRRKSRSRSRSRRKSRSISRSRRK